MARRSKFSFTAIDMLKVDPVSKLLFLQEPIIEKRFSNVLKVRCIESRVHVPYGERLIVKFLTRHTR